MDWDNDFDVKEYHPKKKSTSKKAENTSLDLDNSIPLPAVPALRAEQSFSRDGIIELDGGVMMTTSEILDFAEGPDSFI